MESIQYNIKDAIQKREKNFIVEWIIHKKVYNSKIYLIQMICVADKLTLKISKMRKC